MMAIETFKILSNNNNCYKKLGGLSIPTSFKNNDFDNLIIKKEDFNNYNNNNNVNVNNRLYNNNITIKKIINNDDEQEFQQEQSFFLNSNNNISNNNIKIENLINENNSNINEDLFNPSNKKYQCQHLNCLETYRWPSGRSHHYKHSHKEECAMGENGTQCLKCVSNRKFKVSTKTKCRHQSCNMLITPKNRSRHERNLKIHSKCPSMCKVCKFPSL
ncbi:hypothetical protein CYY_002765 [Polysphondylium violaceum]|uniref:C2H2-type domain-containing protein n=1 Tax=Polysphondylium violaceum TaxID=133409 RepID=A0A8J4V6K4_9MYCE|nr:hypothetical protein CYY_002765 [Polysphondylium violaceum]